MLLCAFSLQEPSPTADRTTRPEPPAGAPMVMVCGDQDILSLVLITSVALFPQALTTLELSTCATHGLALIRSRQPQLLVCIEPLVEEDTLALISQAKCLPAAPKILLICCSFDSQYARKTMEAYCDGILGAVSVNAGAIFQALKVGQSGGTYRDPAVTNGQWNGGDFSGPRQDHKLTPRERQVLQLIVYGCSNGEISEKLCLGISTVKTHVAQLLDKLGARDRTQAAVQAIALGLVPWPSARHAVH